MSNILDINRKVVIQDMLAYYKEMLLYVDEMIFLYIYLYTYVYKNYYSQYAIYISRKI